MKSKKPRALTVRKVQIQADALLTPIMKALFPRCLLCSAPTEVAHHHVHKSKSTRLRYELSNLVNLCHRCHCRLHNNESYEASRIVQIRGIEWFNNLEKMKNEIIKADVLWYSEQLGRLRSVFHSIGKSYQLAHDSK
jgi:5-methylcytosine-specific restriction endonuclease McrA